jgi:pimeloyl-ACP methyl ester carboxylesterase
MNRRHLLTTTVAAAMTSAAYAAPQGSKRTSEFEIDDGTTLFVRDWGKGAPVVFIHGWAMNSDMWQYQMAAAVDAGSRAIAYDRRGHGRSSDPGGGYDYDRLAADLASLMDRLDLRSATLVSHSMGAGEVVRYLTRYGTKRVARIVLIAPSTPFGLKTSDNPEGHDPAMVEQLFAIWRRDFPKWLADNARPFFVPETSQAMVDWGIRMCLQTSLQALIECQRSTVMTDFRDELPKIKVPALIIHGDRDVSEPLERTGRRTAALIPGARLLVYQGAPHGVSLTHMDRVNRDLREFIGLG